MSRHEDPIPLKILIVEDQQRVRDMLVEAVTQWGFDVASARSGEDALRLIETTPPPEAAPSSLRRSVAPSLPHIVLMDLHLPGIGGIETLERIHQTHPDIPAIILTGFGDLDAARRAIRLDVVDFLTKPCSLGDLEQALYRAQRRIRRPTPEVIADPDLATSPEGAIGQGKLEDIEREHILAVLNKHAGNRSETAAELGISLRTLYYRLNEYHRKGFLDEE